MSILRRAVRAYRNNGLTGLKRGGTKLVLNQTNLAIPYAVWESRREVSKSIDNVISKGIGQKLRIEELAEYKTSDTLFVCGSGASINEISESEWEFIAQHDSIGLNRWPIHDFVPTYHVFELPPGEEYKLWRNQYWNLLDEKREQYESVPCVLKDVIRIDEELAPENIPDWIQNDLRISFDHNVTRVDSSVDDQRRLLRYMLEEEYFETHTQKQLLYRKRGSISYLLHLGCVLGYSEIVLCGVDMVNSKYFFDEPGRYEVETDISELVPQRDPDETHRTADEEKWRLTLDDVIYLLDDEVLQEFGIELYVENEVSKLHPSVPVFKYDE